MAKHVAYSRAIDDESYDTAAVGRVAAEFGENPNLVRDAIARAEWDEDGLLDTAVELVKGAEVIELIWVGCHLDVLAARPWAFFDCHVYTNRGVRLVRFHHQLVEHGLWDVEVALWLVDSTCVKLGLRRPRAADTPVVVCADSYLAQQLRIPLAEDDLEYAVVLSGDSSKLELAIDPEGYNDPAQHAMRTLAGTGRSGMPVRHDESLGGEQIPQWAFELPPVPETQFWVVHPRPRDATSSLSGSQRAARARDIATELTGVPTDPGALARDLRLTRFHAPDSRQKSRHCIGHALWDMFMGPNPLTVPPKPDPSAGRALKGA